MSKWKIFALCIVLAFVVGGCTDIPHSQSSNRTFSQATTIVASSDFAIGLKSDGTVVATDLSMIGERSDISHWYDIAAVSAGIFHTVGLRADGTVAIAEDDFWGQFNWHSFRLV